MNKPNCKKCKYFFITWDKNFPYGCHALGFKSKQLPSSEVLKSSGFDCLKFLPKKE
ncbi:MAG: uracil-DNA glycosylase [bacterium]